MDRLTATDATHVFTESAAYPSRIVDGYLFGGEGLSGEVEPEHVLAWLRPRIAHSPVFRSRIRRCPGDLDHPYWVPDPGFDLRRHVTVERAPGPGWDPVRERVARICRIGVPLDRPPWELLVVTGLSRVDGVPDGSCLVVLKIHHAVGDGIEAVALADALFAASPLPACPLPAPASPPRAVLGAIGRVPGSLARFARGSLRAQRLTRAAVSALARGEIEAPRWRWPSTRFNRVPGPGFAFEVVAFDLAEIGVARSRLPGLTVTEVVTAMIGEAMRSYLRERGEEPAESLGGKVAFSLRPHVRTDSRNHFAVLSVDLHDDIADPVERLRVLHRAMESEKARFLHPAVAELSTALDVAPAPYVKWLAWRRSRLPIGQGDTVPLGNTMISNVPRQAADMRFLGGRALGGFGILGVGPGSCLNHYIVTVGTTLTVTFAVDPGRMPDRGRYADLLRAALRRLAGEGGPS